MGLAFYACVPSPFTSFNASLGVILCECCQADSSDILWRGDIVLFSLFTWIVKTCVFILGTSFSWLVPRQQRLLVYTMGGITSHPSSHISAPGWDVFCGRTSHSDSSFISPFGKDKVLFCRFLSNTETRVSCSLNSPFLDFSYTCGGFDNPRVQLLFRITFGMRSNGSPCRCFEPHYPSPHVTVSCGSLLCANLVI